MSSIESTPPGRPESVRTPVLASLCPVCEASELRGRQQVCSAACRRKRSRQREAHALATERADLVAALDRAEWHHQREAEILQTVRRRLQMTAHEDNERDQG